MLRTVLSSLVAWFDKATAEAGARDFVPALRDYPTAQPPAPARSSHRGPRPAGKKGS